MRVNGRWSCFSFSLCPGVSFEVKYMELVSISHELVNTSEQIHLLIVENSRMWVPPSRQFSFLCNFLPSVCQEAKRIETVEYVRLVIVVATVYIQFIFEYAGGVAGSSADYGWGGFDLLPLEFFLVGGGAGMAGFLHFAIAFHWFVHFPI